MGGRFVRVIQDETFMKNFHVCFSTYRLIRHWQTRRLTVTPIRQTASQQIEEIVLERHIEEVRPFLVARDSLFGSLFTQLVRSGILNFKNIILVQQKAAKSI